MSKRTKIFKGTVKSFDENTKTATIVISTGDIDRDMEIVEPSAFKKNLAKYMAHPVLLSCHKHHESLTRQIGECKSIEITDNEVIGVYEWYAGKGNAEADWGWFLVTKGIAAFSIGFLPIKWLDKWSTPMISEEDSKKGVWCRFTEIELFENSQVLVPANPNALQRRLDESQGAEKEVLELAVKSLKDDEVEPFKKAEEEAEKKAYEEKRNDFMKWFEDPVVKESVEKMFDDRIQKAIDKLNIPKHYSELLLGGGADDANHQPTKKQSKDAEEQKKVKQIQKDDLLGATLAGIKEGLK